MAWTNEEVRSLVHVVDLNGSEVTGLILADFSTDLMYIPDGETEPEDPGLSVYCFEIDAVTAPGYYLFTYTPTAAGLYSLTVTEGDFDQSAGTEHNFQTDVNEGAEDTGDALTTLAAVKAAGDISTTGDDALITTLLAQVTSLFETLTRITAI